MEQDELQKAIDKFYENYNGASDLRTPAEKANDYSQTEFVTSAAPVIWVEKKLEDFRSFPVLNQYFTSKCVAFTTAKLALINYWLKTKEFLQFSPNSIYDYRSNKPGEGMIGNDAYKIWRENGISLEAVAKSNQIKESDPFTISLFATEVAKGFKLGGDITIPNGDFDRVASTIQETGKGVMVWFFFTSKDWSLTFPKLISNLTDPYAPEASRHSVTAVDFGLINGVQYLKIEDSAHFGGLNVRYISREFFEARNFLIKYPMNFNYEDPQVTPPPPSTFVFTKTMKFGDTNNDVKELQLYLQRRGYFPTNTLASGYFGNITKDSVKKFQLAKALVVDGICGPKTLAVLNLG